MTCREFGWSKLADRRALDIAVALADFTQRLSLCPEIPHYLSQTLGLEPLTLALVREERGSAPELVISASSGELAAGPGRTVSPQVILNACQQTRRLSDQDVPALRAGFALRHIGAPDNIAEVALQHLNGYPRAIAFAREVDNHHRLLLLVHQRPDATQLVPELAEALQLIATQLSRLLGCLLTWNSHPAKAGAPFDRLTEREWVVLSGLSSEAGEKQLAHELGLSPHTLHSHIKSIYRKVGVQGRLPLLLRAQNAFRALRAKRMQNDLLASMSGENESSSRAALAIG